MLKNTNKQYGNVSVSFHWLSAILVVGMFVLGWWMLTLTYYDEWYRTFCVNRVAVILEASKSVTCHRRDATRAKRRKVRAWSAIHSAVCCHDQRLSDLNSRWKQY